MTTFAKPVESLELRMESGEEVGEHAASSQSEQTAYVGLRKFQQIRSTVLGAIEVSIGIIMTITAISFLIANRVDLPIIAITYWGIIIYIPAGAITIATDKKLTKAMVWATLVLNVLVAISAVAGGFLHFVFLVLAGFSYNYIESQTALAMMAFSILLFIVSILAAAFAGAALCSSRKQLKHTEHTVY